LGSKAFFGLGEKKISKFGHFIGEDAASMFSLKIGTWNLADTSEKYKWSSAGWLFTGCWRGRQHQRGVDISFCIS